jgi:hypothetical protein
VLQPQRLSNTRQSAVGTKGLRNDQDKHNGYNAFSKNPEIGDESHIEINSFSIERTAKLQLNQQDQAKNDVTFYLYIVVNPESDDPGI